MAFHHVAVASKDVKKSHKFYTEVMGFTLKKVVKRQTPEGGWTKHIFYDTGDGELFAIWDLRGIEGVVVEAGQWQGGMGGGLPYWINHIAFDCGDIGALEERKQRWLDYGYNVAEVKHEFIHSIYTRDPDGTLVEWTFDTQPLTEADEQEAVKLLADDTPAQVPDYESVNHRSPYFAARLELEKRDAELAAAESSPKINQH
ncbi:VOC family protein [Mycobacterium sp. pUA109]|uniref:VOC family protein n=1 Tax=Mycobacterium sp. pUA109 TaxID=3238982 RepID=UPI00351B9687